MGLTEWRQHLTDNVYYDGDYVGKLISYTPSGGIAKTFYAVPKLSETRMEFEFSNGSRKRSGTFSVPKSEIASPARGNRIAYAGADFLVTGIESENDLNSIVSVEEIEQTVTGGVIKQ